MVSTLSVSEALASSKDDDDIQCCGKCSRQSSKTFTHSRVYSAAFLALYTVVLSFALLAMTLSFSPAQSYLFALTKSKASRVPSLYST